jgi:GxxExxY protein
MDVFEFRERLNSGVDADTEDLDKTVIGAAIEVHKDLGPCMPERSYLLALCHELELRRIPFRYEVSVPILYKAKEVGLGRVDMVVAGRLVLELKAVEAIAEVHKAQCLTYLKLLKLKLGLVINFNVMQLRTGIKRVINSH